MVVRSRPVSGYKRAKRRLHRGFFYLNDEIVTNSLSALEAGRIDEVVAKVVSAREGRVGFRARIGLPGHAEVGGEASRDRSSSSEENLVRTRTRFSVFEAWYKVLRDAGALGQLTAWDVDALNDLVAGDTIEFSGSLRLFPLQAVVRLFQWWSSEAKKSNSIFAQKGEDLRSLKEADKGMQVFSSLGTEGYAVIAVSPLGKSRPAVIMELSEQWIIGSIGQMSGEYSVIAQVDKVVSAGEMEPVLRLTKDAPPLSLELDLMAEIVRNFVEPAKAVGATVTEQDAAVMGPAVRMMPIAIYR